MTQATLHRALELGAGVLLNATVDAEVFGIRRGLPPAYSNDIAMAHIAFARAARRFGSFTIYPQDIDLPMPLAICRALLRIAFERGGAV